MAESLEEVKAAQERMAESLEGVREERYAQRITVTTDEPTRIVMLPSGVDPDTARRVIEATNNNP
jgi:endonuclease V-like protein UPF0215 family